MNDKLRLVGNVLLSHLSQVVYLQANNPALSPAIGPAYWLTNARIGVRTGDDKYGFSVYANNLFNQACYTYGNSGATGNLFLWGDPRIIGGEITAKF